MHIIETRCKFKQFEDFLQELPKHRLFPFLTWKHVHTVQPTRQLCKLTLLLIQAPGVDEQVFLSTCFLTTEPLHSLHGEQIYRPGHRIPGPSMPFVSGPNVHVEGVRVTQLGASWDAFHVPLFRTPRHRKLMLVSSGLLLFLIFQPWFANKSTSSFQAIWFQMNQT